eukprot:scaffold308136_cov36-Tisochrysis_lutea.AAC.1
MAPVNPSVHNPATAQAKRPTVEMGSTLLAAPNGWASPQTIEMVYTIPVRKSHRSIAARIPPRGSSSMKMPAGATTTKRKNSKRILGSSVVSAILSRPLLRSLLGKLSSTGCGSLSDLIVFSYSRAFE